MYAFIGFAAMFGSFQLATWTDTPAWGYVGMYLVLAGITAQILRAINDEMHPALFWTLTAIAPIVIIGLLVRGWMRFAHADED